jgi:hypothetical protein
MTGVKSPVCCVIGIIVKVNAVRIFEFCKAAESAGKKPGVRKPVLNRRLGSGVALNVIVYRPAEGAGLEIARLPPSQPETLVRD